MLVPRPGCIMDSKARSGVPARGRSVPWTLAASALLLGLATPPAAGHSRTYVTWDVPDYECIDGLLGIGGIVGDVIATLDPFLFDPHGTCFRPGHVFTNANGDVTFVIDDDLQTNVGGCLSQNFDQDNSICELDDDLTHRFCNSETVNVAEGWRFDRFTTHIVVNSLVPGSGLGQLLIGGAPDCGLGQDSFGTVGSISHVA